MTTGITPIHRIIARIGIAVRVHAGKDRVPRVGAEEPGEGGIVIPGVEVVQAGFGVVFLVDVALALGGRGEGFAEGG